MRLRNVFLHVTKRCNLHCSYCYFSASKPLPDEMNTEEFSYLWPDLVSLKPEKVTFTGGEPLLRADIFDLIRGLREADPQHHVLRCLNTNGHLVSRDVAQQLVGLVDEVRVSLDALPDCNDRLRGEGNFEAAFRALKRLRAAGLEPKVLVTVTALSMPHLEEFLCYLIHAGITKIKLNDFRPVGRGKAHQDWSVQNGLLRSVIGRVWKRMFEDFPELPEMPEPDCQTNCGVGQFLNILPNGDVFPCHVLTHSEFRCGNLRNQSLRVICHETGLLAALSVLDFRDLVRQDKALAPLIQPHRCMGEVYSGTRTNAVWSDHLPLIHLRMNN